MEHRSTRAEPAKLEPSYAADLLRRQEALQAEAHIVLADLDLMVLLARAGQPVLVGSAALGLMMWRDIDVEVYCDRWSADHGFETMRPLASHTRVKKLRYSNESGPLRSAGLPDGYYWGVRYYAVAGDEWKIDVWFLPDGAPRPGDGAYTRHPGTADAREKAGHPMDQRRMAPPPRLPAPGAQR